VRQIRISAGAWEAELAPPLGGAVVALRHDGVDILRPAPDRAADPTALSCFPMAPYANRIRDGAFQWEGRDWRLHGETDGNGHSLHGVGWRSAWTCVTNDSAHALLSHTHDGGERWPWRYRAEQDIAIDTAGLHIRLTMTNLAATAAPCGLGLHPYFIHRGDAWLQANFAGVWMSDAAQLPTRLDRADRIGDWTNGETIGAHGGIDNCYSGWDGVARIHTSGHAIVMRAQGARWMHLYAPPGADFFCAEPVSHMPDAINRGEIAETTGLKRLAPGEAASIYMQIGLEA